mmetsp:Transcript_74796/g.146321  ORF Transcript_74796/g.146321 Transcript_74796/m.146321 type:complete len:207 (-) Transcript_74796:455-1075(-)
MVASPEPLQASSPAICSAPTSLRCPCRRATHAPTSTSHTITCRWRHPTPTQSPPPLSPSLAVAGAGGSGVTPAFTTAVTAACASACAAARGSPPAPDSHTAWLLRWWLWFQSKQCSALPTPQWKLRSKAPCAVSHTLMVASQEPLTMVSPALDTPTQLTHPAWPRSVRKHEPLLTSQILSVRSYDPLTSTPVLSCTAKHHTGPPWP